MDIIKRVERERSGRGGGLPLPLFLTKYFVKNSGHSQADRGGKK